MIDVGQGTSMSVDPIPESWERGDSMAMVACDPAQPASDDDLDWPALPSFDGVLSDDSHSPRSGTTHTHPSKVVTPKAPQKVTAAGGVFMCESPIVTPKAPGVHMCESGKSSANFGEVDMVRLRAALSTEPLTASFHGICTSARPAKKKRGQGATGTQKKGGAKATPAAAKGAKATPAAAKD